MNLSRSRPFDSIPPAAPPSDGSSAFVLSTNEPFEGTNAGALRLPVIRSVWVMPRGSTMRVWTSWSHGLPVIFSMSSPSAM